MFGPMHCGEAIPEPTVLAGSLPAPVASSRGRGWRGLVVERYRSVGAEFVLQSLAVLLALRAAPSGAPASTGGESPGHARARFGEVSVIPAGRPWHAKMQGRAQEFHALWLDPALIDRIAAQGEHGPAHRIELIETCDLRDAQIEQIAESLVAELENEQRCSGAYVEALASQLSVHLLRRHARAASGDARLRAAAAGALSPSQLRRAEQFMNAHLGKDLSLAQIAECVGMSPCHFAHLFKRASGIAPHQYLMARRVELAKVLLCETDLPIAEVAHRVGCTNQSHFSTLFHHAEAMSPRAFRRHH